jgi:hypothetical protein
MKILDRYITNEFGRYLCFLSATFIALFLINDFFQNIRMFLSNHATFQADGVPFPLSDPHDPGQTLPAAVLLASLMTVGYLSRHSEIVAMKANGISLYRVAVPILGLSLLVCLFVFVLNEWITPHTTERAEYIRLVEVQKKKSVGNFKQDQIWYRGQKGIYNFKMIEPGTGALRGITLYYLDRDMNLTLRIDADKGSGARTTGSSTTSWSPVRGGRIPVLSKVDEAPVYIPEGPSDSRDAEGRRLDGLYGAEALHRKAPVGGLRRHPVRGRPPGKDRLFVRQHHPVRDRDLLFPPLGTERRGRAGDRRRSRDRVLVLAGLCLRDVPRPFRDPPPHSCGLAGERPAGHRLGLAAAAGEELT